MCISFEVIWREFGPLLPEMSFFKRITLLVYCFDAIRFTLPVIDLPLYLPGIRAAPLEG